MSENKKKYEQEAKAFFADKKNANINTLYVTSDGNLFRAEHYALNWRASNPKLTIEVHSRERPVDAILREVAEHHFNEDGSKKNESSTSAGSSELREALVKEYIELFDAKPSHNIGLDKLQDKITAKRLELEKESSSTAIEHVVTEEDLKNNLKLTEQNVNAGDKIEIPAE